MADAKASEWRRTDETNDNRGGSAKTGGSSPPGYWDAFDIIECTDGRSRRVRPGSFPLAHGIPNRMGRLRGYGNAINPEVAAEFIVSALSAA